MTLDREGALRRAKTIDSEGHTGPLAGIPLSIKDIFDVEGLPTTASSKVLEGNIAVSDAPSVRALRDAGAVIIGKSNTHEFAYVYVSPPTCNPWDTGRIPGGSSGGAAVAVAVSGALGGLGSDTGGSIRVPAALNGISGLMPRSGIVSLEGVVPLAPSLDRVGPLARTAEDLSILWEVLSGHTPSDGLPSFTLGIPEPTAFGEVESSVMKAYEQAVEEIRSTASSTRPITLPAFEDFNIPRGAIVMPESLAVHKERGWWPDHADEYSEELRTYLEFGEMFMTPDMVESGLEFARLLVERFNEGMQDVDIAVTPSAPCGAPTHEEAAEAEENSPRRPIAFKLMRLPGAVNMAGLAAMSIPCGFTDDGLPIGLQLIGRDEELLLSVAERYQSNTDWHTRRPPL